MPTPAKKPATTPIPVQLSNTEFTEFILPHLSMPKRGPKCKLGYSRVGDVSEVDLQVSHRQPKLVSVHGLSV